MKNIISWMGEGNSDYNIYIYGCKKKSPRILTSNAVVFIDGLIDVE